MTVYSLDAAESRQTMANPPGISGITIVLAILADYRRRWLTLVLLLILSALVGIGVTRMSQPRYSAYMSVVPVEERNPLDSLASSGGILSNALSARGANRDYELFLATLTSLEVAEALAPTYLQRVFHKSWDAEAGRWKPDGAVKSFIKTSIEALMGFDMFFPMSARNLQKYLDKRLDIEPTRTSKVITIRMEGADPQLAKDLLQAVFNEADEKLKAQKRWRLAQEIAGIEESLKDAANPEIRSALIRYSLLKQRELATMTGKVPLAVQLVEGPIVSTVPSSPSLATPFIVTVGMFGFILFLFAAATFVSLYRHAANARG